VVKAKERYKFYLYAYVLMANHYHLLIETREANLSRIMQNINTSYTTYHNVKYKRSGHLFQGRYKSIVVEKERYYMELSRYIHLNPVRAGMVKEPEEYKWSSYRGYLSRKGDGYIDKARISETMAMGSKGYREFVEEGIGKKVEPFKGLYGGFILGSVKFIKGTLSELKDQVEGLREVSYKGELRQQVAKEQIIAVVEKKYGKGIEEIRRSKKRPMKEKKMLIYLLRRLTGLTNREIGEVAGMNYAAVSMSGVKTEDEIKRDKRNKKEADEIVFTFEG
jgi:REP element-mobilizing transposase RayT